MGATAAVLHLYVGHGSCFVPLEARVQDNDKTKRRRHRLASRIRLYQVRLCESTGALRDLSKGFTTAVFACESSASQK